jgi:transcriptional regulator with XRE-family HTH domain
VALTVGERIRSAREGLKMSQVALAKLVGVSRGAIYNWERGKTEIRKGKRRRLANVLRMEPSDLIDLTPFGEVSAPLQGQPPESGEQAAMRNRVQEVRLQRGWTLEELAEKAGLSTSQVSKVENGKRGWSVTSLESLAKALGVDVSELFHAADEDGENAVVLRRIDNTVSRMAEDIDEIKGRLSELDSRVTNLDKRLDGMQKRLDNISRRD